MPIASRRLQDRKIAEEEEVILELVVFGVSDLHDRTESKQLLE